MAIQTATYGALEDAQNIVVAKIKETAEHATPCRNLIEQFTLGKGNKSITVPKVGQVDAANLTDGVDLTTSADIGMTSIDLTTGEVGLKFILTQKLLDQESEDMFKIVGKQMGDAMARKIDRDIIALFAALNGASVLGADNKYLLLINAMNCVSYLTAQKAPGPFSFVHHPNAIFYLINNMGGAGQTYYPGIITGLQEETLRNHWKANLAGCNFYQDGNIDKITGYDSGYGAVFSKSAMCFVTGRELKTKNQEDISLRAYEVVTTMDYGVFELDDTYGAACQYEIGTNATNA